MTNMEHFYIQDNLLTGTISTSIGNFKSSLRELRVSQNQLDGTIPTELGDSLRLGVAWFHLNNLNGTMPSSMCNLKDNYGLIGLQADCDPSDPFVSPAVECDCCTSCCKQGLGLFECFLKAGNPNIATLPPGTYDKYKYCLDADGNPKEEEDE